MFAQQVNKFLQPQDVSNGLGIFLRIKIKT